MTIKKGQQFIYNCTGLMITSVTKSRVYYSTNGVKCYYDRAKFEKLVNNGTIKL